MTEVGLTEVGVTGDFSEALHDGKVRARSAQMNQGRDGLGLVEICGHWAQGSSRIRTECPFFLELAAAN